MKTPTIQWSQNDNYVFIDIHLEPKEYELNIQEKNLVFKQGEYEVNMTLFSKIIPDESKYNKNRIFEIYLKKDTNNEEDKDDDEYNEWRQLLENKNQYNVSINWDKYDVEDDELPDMEGMEGMSGMPDLSSMMGGDGMPDLSSMMEGMSVDSSSTNGCCEGDEYCKLCPDQNLLNNEKVDGTDDETDEDSCESVETDDLEEMIDVDDEDDEDDIEELDEVKEIE